MVAKAMRSDRFLKRLIVFPSAPPRARKLRGDACKRYNDERRKKFDLAPIGAINTDDLRRNIGRGRPTCWAKWSRFRIFA
jgi:hypothetical protein